MDRRALERLGHHVVSRRVALGYRNRTDLASSLQFTVRTLSDIEHGVRKASPGTYAMLENKLAWAPGSIDTILAGGEPNEVVSTLHRAPAPPPGPRDTRCARPTPTPSPRCPPRNCCWSCDAASSPPATDATTPGTTGTAAWTRTATGPKRASRHGSPNRSSGRIADLCGTCAPLLLGVRVLDDHFRVSPFRSVRRSASAISASSPSLKLDTGTV